MNPAIFSFLVITFAFSSFVFGDESIGRRARTATANIIYPYAVAVVEGSVEGSGLSQSEIVDLIDRAADGYALCFVMILESLEDEDADEVLRLTADGLDEAELETLTGERYAKVTENAGAYKPELNACLLDVSQKLGIKGHPIP